jgi:acyl-CoA-binding protein
MKESPDYIDSLFEVAKASLKSIGNLSDNLPNTWPIVSVADKLSSYAFFKQATKGNCLERLSASLHNKSVSAQKWLAWSKLKGNPGALSVSSYFVGMTQEDAKRNYCKPALCRIKYH